MSSFRYSNSKMNNNLLNLKKNNLQKNNNLIRLSNKINKTPHKFNDFIKHYKIKQIYVSNSLIHLNERIKNHFNLKNYDNINEPCIFFGVYTNNDIMKINHHRGLKFIMYGGSDSHNHKKVYSNNHLSISVDLKNRLLKDGKFSLLIYLNLVDRNLFKPVTEKGTKIFIYDGIRKKKDNDRIYGKKYHDAVTKRLSNFEYIYSSNLNLPYEKMPDIYKQCFIGLRLTPRDGNANMVQELEAMCIPVVHNQSNYGLKWKNVDDIINLILKIYNNG